MESSVTRKIVVEGIALTILSVILGIIPVYQTTYSGVVCIAPLVPLIVFVHRWGFISSIIPIVVSSVLNIKIQTTKKGGSRHLVIKSS